MVTKLGDGEVRRRRHPRDAIVGQALGPNTEVLFSEPPVEKIDILAAKLP
jgi:hypothetical protein